MTIQGSSQILGVFGDPVNHSLSPIMHAYFAEETGCDTVYVPFHVRGEDLSQALAALPALSIRGVNLTVPHKEAAMSFLDGLEPAARSIGAVNTVSNEGGRLVGDNTDARGFLADLWAHFPDRLSEGTPTLVIGAGGAARAIVYALNQAGIPDIWVANRNQDKASHLVAEFCPGTGSSLGLEGNALASAAGEAGLIINTTSLGLHGESIPGLDLAVAGPQTAVYDLIYNPAETPLLREARSRGLARANGLGMLVRQGAESYRIWTGQMPTVDSVIEAFKEQIT